jgi:hypothetical protein
VTLPVPATIPEAEHLPELLVCMLLPTSSQNVYDTTCNPHLHAATKKPPSACCSQYAAIFALLPASLHLHAVTLRSAATTGSSRCSQQHLQVLARAVGVPAHNSVTSEQWATRLAP